MEAKKRSNAAKPMPSHEDLHKLLSYNPETGDLFWRPRGDPAFDGQFAGRRALNYKGPFHKSGRIYGIGHLAHRIIWKLVYGEDPDEIDHINGDGFDNRLANLRSVSHAENMRNMSIHKRNTSGVSGVNYVARVKRWRAYITVGRAQRHLGYFEHYTDAVAARLAAEAANDFHENHGKGPTMIHLSHLPKVRSKHITQAARGEDCTVRFPGICCHNPETTVFAHLPGIGKGVGTKVSDLHGVFACHACHAAIDQKSYKKKGISDSDALMAMLRALCETQAKLIAAGIITVKGNGNADPLE